MLEAPRTQKSRSNKNLLTLVALTKQEKPLYDEDRTKEPKSATLKK
jgi:hypothetical protein